MERNSCHHARKWDFGELAKETEIQARPEESILFAASKRPLYVEISMHR